MLDLWVVWCDVTGTGCSGSSQQRASSSLKNIKVTTSRMAAALPWVSLAVTYDRSPEIEVLWTGFDFTSSGLITLKAYFLSSEHAPWVRSPEKFKTRSPVCIGGPDVSPLRAFTGQIYPAFAESFDMITDHINELKPEQRPVYEFISMDCKSPVDNRLKVCPLRFRYPLPTHSDIVVLRSVA